MTFILETPRLILQTWNNAKQHEYDTLYRDPLALKYYSGTTDKLKNVIAHQNKFDFSFWACVEKVSQKIIGSIGFMHFDKNFVDSETNPRILKKIDNAKNIDFGYHFHADCWNKGFATEASKACLDYGFKKLGFKCILAMTSPINLASRRVLEKIGMHDEGHFTYNKSHYELYSSSLDS